MGTECRSCSFASTGFSFSWQLNNDLFSADAVAPLGADSPYDCVSEFSQIADGAWYLPTTGNSAMNVTANVSTFAACVALCVEPDCQYVTYDYLAATCYVRMAIEPYLSG
jgi:hypothetical protein